VPGAYALPLVSTAGAKWCLAFAPWGDGRGAAAIAHWLVLSRSGSDGSKPSSMAAIWDPKGAAICRHSGVPTLRCSRYWVFRVSYRGSVNGVANKSVGSEGCESPYHQLPGLDG
jgi:hypothetical protein